MNVKKMFASLTGVLMLATTVSPLVTGAATYSDELQGAYDYAYSKGITTMGSIDNANMYGDLTRGQLSKMISQWAEKEMGVKADSTAVCSFSDADTAQGDLASYLVKACQMGLMGQGIEKFRPNDKVTRGEFGTTLSRAIWGDKYDGENPFYAKHLQALKDAGIMNNISDPNATEMRGWVMLMLQRAAETVNPSECNDPAVLLACSLGSDQCPAACVNKKTDEEDNNKPSNISDMPVAGDLTIAVADYSSEVRSVPMAGTVVFNAVDFKASEKVTIESVKLERTGLSDKSAIGGVWFEKDGVAVSAKASLSTDGTATTRFYNNYSVNGTETLDLVVELKGTKAGAEVAFKIVDATTTAKNVSLNTQTSTYRTTEYTVANVDFVSAVTVGANATEYKVGDTKSFEIGKIKLTNQRVGSEDRNVIVKSLKLKNDGTMDLGETLKNVYVVRDSKTVSKKVELDGKYMTIYFDDEEIVSGKSNQYTIFAEVAQLNETGKTVQLTLNKESELVANEASSNFRVTVTGKGQLLKKYQFNGGKITFTNDSTLSKTVNAADGSSDVVLARGTLTVSEPVKFNSITINSLTEPAVTTANQSNVIKDLKVEIGGSTYYLNTKCAANATACAYSYDEEIYVSKTSDFKVLANIRSGIGELTVTFDKVSGASFGNNTKAGTYDNSDESDIAQSDIAGTVQISKLTVKPGKFTITNKSSTTQKVTKNSSDDAVIFDGEITTKDGTVSINELVISNAVFTPKTARNNVTNANGLDGTEQIDFTLYVNGEPFSTQTLRGGSDVEKTFSSLGDVKSGEPMKIKIVAQPNIGVEGKIIVKIGAEGSDAQGNKVQAVAVNAAQLDITAGAELTVSNSNSKSAVVKDGSNTEIISFTTTVKNSSYDLGAVVATLGAAAPILDNQTITLEIDGDAVGSALYCAYSANANGVCYASNDTNASTNPSITFAGLNETMSAKQHTITLKANLNVSATQANNTFTVSNVKLWSTSKNHTNDAEDALVTTNAKRLVVKAYPTISSKVEGDDLILTITNPSDNEDDITIVGFGMTSTEDINVAAASINGKVLALGKVATYAALKDSNNVAVTETVAPGNSVEFRVQASAGTNGNTVQVTSIILDGATITSDYTNVGNWPAFKVTAKK